MDKHGTARSTGHPRVLCVPRGARGPRDWGEGPNGDAPRPRGHGFRLSQGGWAAGLGSLQQTQGLGPRAPAPRLPPSWPRRVQRHGRLFSSQPDDCALRDEGRWATGPHPHPAGPVHRGRKLGEVPGASWSPLLSSANPARPPPPWEPSGPLHVRVPRHTDREPVTASHRPGAPAQASSCVCSSWHL